MTDMTFPQALSEYKKSIKKTSELALACSIMALGHYAQHGDVTYIQQFFAATPKNYGRREAFKLWACDHAPLMFDQGAFKKDHDRAENGENGAILNVELEAAQAKPFWDYHPEKEAQVYAPSDVITQLKRVTGRYHNENRYKPEDDKAVAFLSKVDAKINELAELAAAGSA